MRNCLVDGSSLMRPTHVPMEPCFLLLSGHALAAHHRLMKIWGACGMHSLRFRRGATSGEHSAAICDVQDAKEAAKKAKAAKAAAKIEKMKAFAAVSTKAAEKKAKAKAESDAKKVGLGIFRIQASVLLQIFRTCPSDQHTCHSIAGCLRMSVDGQNVTTLGLQAAEAEELAAALRAVQATPKGEKKDTTAPMLKGYDPPVVEAAWWVLWWTQSR